MRIIYMHTQTRPWSSLSATKTRRRNITGGKALASGGYGCVFSPALQCVNSHKGSPLKEGRISKLMTVRHANAEYTEILRIRKKLESLPNYKDYFLIYDVSLCNVQKLSNEDLIAYDSKCNALTKHKITKSTINSKLNEVASLNMPYGGIPVDDYFYENGSFLKIYETHNQLVKLLKNGILPMNARGIYHSDIKDSNVLVDNGKTRLVDWGLSVEYKPTTSENDYPYNWKNRPFQFNVPFSIILFSDKFNAMYSAYLSEGHSTDPVSLRPFVVNFVNDWINNGGAGHYKFINEIMYILYGDKLTSVADKNKTLMIETEITMPIIVDYIVDILAHFTKLSRTSGPWAQGSGFARNANKNIQVDMREYLNKVFIKIIDIWGFIMIYYPLIEMLHNSFDTLTEPEIKIFKHLQYIFGEYLYKPHHTPIDLPRLYKDLHILGKIIHRASNGSKLYGGNTAMISHVAQLPTFLQGPPADPRFAKPTTKTRRTKPSPTARPRRTLRTVSSARLFKRIPRIKRFKNPFFMRIHNSSSQSNKFSRNK